MEKKNWNNIVKYCIFAVIILIFVLSVSLQTQQKKIRFVLFYGAKANLARINLRSANEKVKRKEKKHKK